MAKHYDVAISYASDDRQIAKRLAAELRGLHLSVFFDEEAGSELWGQGLYDYLKKIYEGSRVCAVVISPAYLNNEWARIELRNLTAHAQKPSSREIAPVAVGNVAIPRELSGLRMLDLDDLGVKATAEAIKRRLAALPKAEEPKRSENFHVIKRESGWSVKRSGAVRATSVHATQKDAIAAARETAKRHGTSEFVVHRQDGTIASRERVKAK